MIPMIEDLNIDEREILEDIAIEYIKAKKKHPKWPEDKIHAACIVAEENGELQKAVLQEKYEGGSIDEIRKEAIQTGAMALRFLVNL